MRKDLTLAALSTMAQDECDGLTVDEIVIFEKLISDKASELSMLYKKIEGAKLRRYESDSLRALKANGKDFGTTNYQTNNGYEVKVTIPKNVSWDQKLARAAVETLHQMGEDVHEYVEFDVKISEAKWNAWPAKIRKIFQDARTTKPGKTKIEIVKKGE